MKSKTVSECRFLMDIWDNEKNKDLNPEELSSLSQIKAWWKCNTCGYEWQSQIKTRTISNGSCPKCRRFSNKKVSVSSVPDLMKYWGNNPDITPDDVSSYSKRVVNWRCPDCGYTWSSQVFTRMTSSSGCPACSRKVASKNYNALTEFPELEKYYDATVLDNPRLERLLPNARDVVHWECPDCGYKWEQSLHERIRRHGGVRRVASCPVCAGISVKGVNTNLSTEHPNIAKEWDAEKNGKSFDGIKATSTANYWWKCSEGHSYCMSPNDVLQTYKQGRIPCPYCDGRRILPGFNSLKALYPDLMKEWDEISNYALINPDEVGPGSKEDAWWICPNGHSYIMRINHRVMFSIRKMTACPQCKGQNRKKSHIYKREQQ